MIVSVIVAGLLLLGTITFIVLKNKDEPKEIESKPSSTTTTEIEVFIPEQEVPDITVDGNPNDGEEVIEDDGRNRLDVREVE
jgi:hypothetical protein